VARAEEFPLTVARRRRLCTVFPYTESQVSVDGGPLMAEAPLAKRDAFAKGQFKGFFRPSTFLQNDARPTVRPDFDFERRFKDFLEQGAIVYLDRRTDAQALPLVQ